MIKKLLLIILLLYPALFAADSVWGDKPNVTDPIYGLKIDKYPKFTATVTLKNGKKIRFCCVKSMLHFYYKPWHFPEYGIKDPAKIAKMEVKDYLDGKAVDAKKAWYVFGSRVAGPHGDDLIPLSTRTRAELFTKRYGGTRIMDFKTVEKKGYGLIKFLDMP